MKIIKLFYNPYTESARLIVNGKERRQSGRRLDSFVVGQPINRWLTPYVLSYHRWDGLLPELMAELNDDELSLSFYSIPSFFSMVKEQLQTQSQTLQEKGYASDSWVCEYIEHFVPEVIAKRMARFIEDNKPSAPNQNSLEYFIWCKRQLSESEPSMELLRLVAENLQQGVRAAQAYYTGERESAPAQALWSHAERELERLYECSGRAGT